GLNTNTNAYPPTPSTGHGAWPRIRHGVNPDAAAASSEPIPAQRKFFSREIVFWFPLSALGDSGVISPLGPERFRDDSGVIPHLLKALFLAPYLLRHNPQRAERK